MAFVIRKLNDAETLGQKLKALRLAIPRTIGEMAELSKLRRHIIEAFEADRHDRLPAPLYTRQFLKSYVQALGGDVDYFLERYESECGTCDFTKASRLPLRRAKAIQFLVASHYVKVAVIGVFAFALVGYLGFELQAITSAPKLAIYAPADGLATEDASIRVAGQAEGESTVFINGTEVLLGKDGSFETDVSLTRGLNIITIESSKRYSRPAREERRVVFTEGGYLGLGQ